MQLKPYLYVLEILECQGVTAAAQKLYMSQSSLSQYLSKIESELGAKIFNRKTTPISLTPCGEVYVRYARSVIDLHQQMRRQLADVAVCKRGILQVGISSSRSTYMLPKVIAAFRELYPLVDVQLYQKNVFQLEQALADNKLGFAILPIPLEHEDFHNIAIYQERLILLTQKGRLAYTGVSRGDIMPLNLLHNEPFILLNEENQLHKICHQFFAREQYQGPVILETSTNECACEFVQAGMGSTILPHSVLDTVYRFYDFDYYELPSAHSCWTVSVVHRKQYTLNLFERDFIALLQEVFSRQMQQDARTFPQRIPALQDD